MIAEIAATLLMMIFIVGWKKQEEKISETKRTYGGIHIGKMYHLTGCGGGKAVFVVERFVGKMPFGNAYWITGEPSFIKDVGFPKKRLKYPSLEEIKLFDDLKKRVMAEEETK